jgi:hypothetical protein
MKRRLYGAFFNGLHEVMTHKANAFIRQLQRDSLIRQKIN